MKVRPISAAVLCSVLLGLVARPGAAITQSEVDGLRAQIDAPGLDERGAVIVAGSRLRVGSGVLTLRTGRIYPARAVALEDVVAPAAREYVFVGEGLLEVAPDDAIEARQLEIFAGARRLREPISAAVLVVANDGAAAAIASHPTVESPAGPAMDRAQELLAAWRASPERRILGVEEAILADVLGESAAANFFVGAFEGKTLGRFLLSVEPRSTEQVAMGKFEPIEMTEKERRKIGRIVHHEQRRGRMLGVSEDSLGQWDSWLSMPLERDGAKAEGQPSFEPVHYEIDATIASGGDAIDGRARISLRAEGSGSRVATFDLLSDLLVTAAFEGDAPAPFVQSEDRVTVVLDRAPSEGETIVVELRWAGQAFDQTGSDTGRSFHLRDTLLWYPHAGEEDLATYDVTLRWPKKWELLAAGKLEGEGVDGALRWQRRRVERPTMGYTFQFGRFETLETRVGPVRVEVAIDAASRSVLTGRQALLDAVVDATTFLTGVFGPLPSDELLVVTNQQDFSQSMLGFVTLSLDMTRDDILSAVLGGDDPRTTIAHEISHQWWGHLVSWRSYRDQWLSESLADYSAAYYARKHLPQRARVWSGPLDDWEDTLEATATTGQSIESLGPVVLGERLESSLSEDAYQAIVYTKGALVLNALAQRVGEDAFHSVLRWLAEKAAGRPVSTADFLRVVSDATRLDLGPFADMFVYGTGVPELEYSYRSAQSSDGKWRVAIDVERTPSYRFTYRVAERPDAGLDVLREVVADQPASTLPSLAVPFAVTLGGGASGEPPPTHRAEPRAAAATLVGKGVLLLEGDRSHVELDVPGEPATLTLDPDRLLPGRFFDVTRMDQGTLLRRGYQALASGSDGAAALFEQALDAGGGDELSADLELARLALDRGAEVEAERRLQAADAALKRVGAASRPELELEILLVESRLDLRRGDARGVARRLARAWDDGWLEDGEGLLLLAVAARQSGDSDLFGEALEAARKRRTEVTDLGPLLDRKAERPTAP